MLVVEALAALWFWTRFASVVSVPAHPEPFLPAFEALERAWDTPPEAWLDPLASEYWKRHWKEQTGCCVDFVFEPEGGACRGSLRLVQAKALPEGRGWKRGYVAVACG